MKTIERADGTRNLKMYAELWHAANSLQKVARLEVRGSHYTELSSLVMRAFALEAFLNHMGEGVLQLWKRKDRRSVREKLENVTSHLGLSMDPLVRPYSTVTGLIKFRNTLAHGRTTELHGSVEYDPTDVFGRQLKAEFEQFNTEENRAIVEADVAAIIESIHAAAGLGDYPWTQGFSVFSVTLVQANETSPPAH
jgi:hypothetical protein